MFSILNIAWKKISAFISTMNDTPGLPKKVEQSPMNTAEPLATPKKTNLLRLAIAVYIVWVAVLAGLALTSSEKPRSASTPAASR